MASDYTVRHLDIASPEVETVLSSLDAEYKVRYPEQHHDEMGMYPVSQFVAPEGGFVGVFDGDLLVAAGAIRRYDDATAEVKRMWTRDSHRRRGLGLVVLQALDVAAEALGYTRIFLTTGPRQPEAVALYEAAGFTGGLTSVPDFPVPIYAFQKPAGQPIPQRVDATAEPARSSVDTVDAR